MQVKYEYLNKKEVIDNIKLFKSQLRAELGKYGKEDIINPEIGDFNFPPKNMQTVISCVGHSFSIVNVGRCRYNLTISI